MMLYATWKNKTKNDINKNIKKIEPDILPLQLDTKITCIHN